MDIRRRVGANVKRFVNRRWIGTPDRHAIGTPLRVVPVVHRRDPRAPRSALTSDGAARAGGPCAPTGGTPRGWGSGGGGFAVQARFLKRQLSLPVSTISQ